MEEGNDSAPVLTYQSQADANVRRGQRLLLYYSLGLIAGTFLIAALMLRKQPSYWSSRTAILDVCLMSGGFGLAYLVPGTFGIALAAWLRHRKSETLHYRGKGAPIFWGLGAGLIATIALPSWFWLGFLIVYSIIAGLCLCSAPREEEQASPRLAQKFLRHILVTGSILLLLIGGGYMSAWMSRRACERRVDMGDEDGTWAT